MTKPVGRPRKDLALYRNGNVTDKRRALVMAMVWDSLPLKEAAVKAGLAEVSARQALRMVAVSKLMDEERRARLSGERPRNLAALADVRDTSANAIARVAAAKALEMMAVDAGLDPGASNRHVPGIVIMVGGAALPVTGPSGREMGTPALGPLIELSPDPVT